MTLPHQKEGLQQDVVPLGSPEHRDGADHGAREAERAGHLVSARQDLELLESHPGRHGDHAIRRNAAGDHQGPDGLPAGDHAVREPAVHGVQPPADGNRHMARSHDGHAAEPPPHAPHPPVDGAVGVDHIDSLPPDQPCDAEHRPNVPGPAHPQRARLEAPGPGALVEAAPRLAGDEHAPAAGRDGHGLVEGADLLTAEPEGGLRVQHRPHDAIASRTRFSISSTVIPRMQPWSIGQLPRKHGAHGAPAWTT